MTQMFYDYDPLLFYNDTGITTNKSTFDILFDKLDVQANGVDSILISNVPNNTKVIISNSNYEDETTSDINGSDTFTTNIVGLLTFKFTNPKFVDMEVQANAY